MKFAPSKITTVDAYIAAQPPEIAARLVTIRALIQRLVPEAVESMAYGMPAYKLQNKPLIYFAGYANHIGIYATPSGHSAFAAELAWYKQGKWSVQFPHDQPLPLALIEQMIMFKKDEIEQKKW